MAAHLREVPRPPCNWSGCQRPAVWTLHNTRNAPIADYCGAHARKALAEWQQRHPDERP